MSTEDPDDSERERYMRMLGEESDPDDPDYASPVDSDEGSFNSSNSSSSSSSSSYDSEYEEELLDRFRLEIENDVAHFRDELSIRHDVCPDSDTEAENANEEVEVVAETPGTRRHRIRRRGDGRLYYRQVFDSGASFKEVVLDYALTEGRNIKQSRWDKTNLEYRCAIPGCQWRIYCALQIKRNRWQVTAFKRSDGDVHSSCRNGGCHSCTKGDHSCNRDGGCQMLTDLVIAVLFLDKIREDPKLWKPKMIQTVIKDQWRISVTRNQCQEARKKALRWIEKEHEVQFANIRGYCNEITETNPNSTVSLDTIVGPNGEDLFDRFYVCFHKLKDSWKRACRPIIGVDGTFLRSTFSGQLLIAQGRDAENKIYPIAWAVVKVENEDNWLWFMRLLKKDLDLKDGDGYILISDRQKGLINAVEIETPLIEHRKCVQHIYGNIKAQTGKKMDMKMLIWQLAWSYNETQFKKNLKMIEAYDIGVYTEVLKRKPETWCRAFYKIDGKCCEDVENNSVESFNNSIVIAREKPFMPMLETIRRLAMVRIRERSIAANRWGGKYTAYVQKFLDAEYKDASACLLYPGSIGIYEVQLGYDYESVDLNNWTCSCCKWQICGIPCEHAYGVILKKKLNPDNYVNDWFLTERLIDLYADNINPVRGPGHWATGDVALVTIRADQQRSKKKKKKKLQKMIKGKNESPSKKKNKNKRKSKKNKKQQVDTDEAATDTYKKRTMHCKKCGQAGHNARSCGKRSKKNQVEASETQSTQPMSQVVD